MNDINNDELVLFSYKFIVSTVHNELSRIYVCVKDNVTSQQLDTSIYRYVTVTQNFNRCFVCFIIDCIIYDLCYVPLTYNVCHPRHPSR